MGAFKWLWSGVLYPIIPLLELHPRARQLGRGRVNVLMPPPGAPTWGRGGGWGPDSASSSAFVETDLDLAAVAAYYAAQLEEAGWSRTDECQSGPRAWSTWTFTDAENRRWIGAFTALWLPGTPAWHLLQVRADRTPDR